tara:strand:+ start:873 stop:1349 length:477 start_codon:yes stop_codon:yes gene_type:complete
MTNKRQIYISFTEQPLGSFPPLNTTVNRAQEITDGHSELSESPDVEGLFVISVAARILEMHPQTLRKYERLGLVIPNRTIGMLRLYSREDIRKLMVIKHLMENVGLNLAGIEFVLSIIGNLSIFKDRLNALITGPKNIENLNLELDSLFNSFNLPLEI